MEIAKEARDRIFSAANSLYEQAGRAGNFPTVDAVRKLAKVNMNDASVGMKEWRRTQTTQAAPVAVQVPEAVQNANAVALANLWHEAQELANESLRAAQAGWDAERIEAETLNKQIGDAYEALSLALDATQQDAALVKMSFEQSEAMVQDLQAELEAATVALTAARAATVMAEARTVEIKHRADELRSELDHAHQEASQVREELATLRQTHHVEVEVLRAATAVQQARSDDAVAKAEALRTDLATAREEAANLRGKMDAITDQNSQLLQTLKSAQAKGASNSKKE